MNTSRRGARRVISALAAATLEAVITGEASARADTIRGKVRTADGAPAPGAKVWAARLVTRTLDRHETITDDQGRFTLDAGPGEWMVWAASGTQAGGTWKSVKLPPGGDAEPIAITLAEWGRLRGRLIEAESARPISGGKMVLDNAVVATTDDQGWFEAVGLGPDGRHEAFTVCPGRARMRVLFFMSDRAETELEVRVPRAGKIVGRVTDERGRPIPGALVGRSTSGHWISTTALFIRTDDEGRFEYDGVLPDRPTWLGAEAEGYEADGKDNLMLDPKIGSLGVLFRLSRVPDAPRREPNLAAPVKATQRSDKRDVTGIVLGPGDQPIAGAVVRWGATKHMHTVRTTTGADGHFRLEGVPDQDGVVAVLPRGSTLAPAFAFAQGRGDQDVRVSLLEGRSVRGVVRDDRGEPFSGVSVTPVVFSPDPNWGGLVWLDELGGQTDAQGRFQLAGLPLTGVKFDFLRPGLSDLRNQILELDGPDNIVTMQAGGAIRGRVVDWEQRPVRSFRVLLGFPREHHAADKGGGFFAGFSGIGLTYTSDDGTFVVKELVAGSVQRLSVIAPG
jgi:hypothetical protein